MARRCFVYQKRKSKRNSKNSVSGSALPHASFPVGQITLSITAPNDLLLAAYNVSPESLPDWAQLIAADVSNVGRLTTGTGIPIPVLAHHITDYNNDRKAKK